MNVGSIKLHFDEILKTNLPCPSKKKFVDQNYSTLTELDGAFWKHPVRKRTLGKTFVDQVNPDEVLSVDQYLYEFDIKDMVGSKNAKSKMADFVYSAASESTLAFNVINSFKTTAESSDGSTTDTDDETKSRELISKLEQPGSQYERNKTFTVTPNGVFLRKGEEVGMFEMGSTIVMLFECPKQSTVVPQPGDKLLMGQRITQ